MNLAMELPEWNPCLREQDFQTCGDVERDLISFAKVYMCKVTPRMVKVSIGLRTPELYKETVSGIMEVPQTFKKVLLDYFLNLQVQGKLKNFDAEALTMQFISMNFGFVFLDASFEGKLSGVSKEEYIESVKKNVQMSGKTELPEMVQAVCRDLKMPWLMKNPLFERTVKCHLEKNRCIKK